MKVRLQEVFDENSVYQVIESMRQEERPIPAILVVAGDAMPAFDVGELTGNYTIPFNVVVMTSADDGSVDEHSNVVQAVSAKLREPVARSTSVIQNLYIYAIHGDGIVEDNQERRFGTLLSYTAVVNYAPDLGTDYVPQARQG